MESHISAPTNLSAILASPPPSVIPNMVNPESRAWQVYVTAAICGVLVLLFNIIQIYTRFFILKRVWYDDYGSTISALGVYMYIGFAVNEVQHGYGRHSWDNDQKTFTNKQQSLFIISNFFYPLIILLVKLSLFLLFLKLFDHLRIIRYAIYYGIAFTLLFYLASMASFLALCIPKPGKNFLETAQESRCRRAGSLEIVQGVVDILSDFYLLLIPIPPILQLKLRPRQKIGLLSIFMTGLLACVSSCLGLWSQYKFNQSTDTTWDAIDPIIMVIIEMSVGIIVGSMLLLPAFFRHVGSSVNAWFGTFAVIFVTREPQPEAGLARNSEQPSSIEIELYGEIAPSKDMAIASKSGVFYLDRTGLYHEGNLAASKGRCSSYVDLQQRRNSYKHPSGRAQSI